MAKLTEKQIRWASEHDWFVREAPEPGRIEVRERYMQEGEVYEKNFIWTGTFRELRDWAGY